MELESVLQFLEDKTILITGGTGFLAKSIFFLFLSFHQFWVALYNFIYLFVFDNILTVLLEKILRVQPNIRKIYVHLRAVDDKSAMHRLNTEVQIILEQTK